MKAIEKIKIVLNKGIDVDLEKGIVYGVRKRPIGRVNANGYVEIRYNNEGKVNYIMAHQLVFYKKHGYIPNYIDHINRIKTDNRIDNLREVTCAENMWNLSEEKKGYHFSKREKKFIVKIRANRKRYYVGSFENEADAKAAYLNAKKIYQTNANN